MLQSSENPDMESALNEIALSEIELADINLPELNVVENSNESATNCSELNVLENLNKNETHDLNSSKSEAPEHLENIPIQINDSNPAVVLNISESMTFQRTKKMNFWESLVWMKNKTISGVEFVGECVASAIGLDESRFQEQLDGMTEEEWNYALKVQEQREEEERQYKETLETAILEEGLIHNITNTFDDSYTALEE